MNVCVDDKLNVPKMVISVFDRDENIVGKGENAGNQHFLLFPHVFKRHLPEGHKNEGLFGKG